MQVSAVFDNQVNEWHETKAAIAPALTSVVKNIIQTGNNPDNILADIVKMVRMLDIAAPAPRLSPLTATDPRFHLLDYIKRNAGSNVFKEIDGNELLFNKNKPFTCIGQIQEIFQDVTDKLSKNYVTQQVANA